MQTWHGHFSNLLGSFVLAYSYTYNQLVLLIVGVVIIWLAMLLLTKVDRQKEQSTLVPGDLELPGALEDIPNAKERKPNTKIAARAIDPTDARAEQASAFSVKKADSY